MLVICNCCVTGNTTVSSQAHESFSSCSWCANRGLWSKANIILHLGALGPWSLHSLVLSYCLPHMKQHKRLSGLWSWELWDKLLSKLRVQWERNWGNVGKWEQVKREDFENKLKLSIPSGSSLNLQRFWCFLLGTFTVFNKEPDPYQWRACSGVIYCSPFNQKQLGLALVWAETTKLPKSSVSLEKLFYLVPSSL